MNWIRRLGWGGIAICLVASFIAAYQACLFGLPQPEAYDRIASIQLPERLHTAVGRC